MLQTFWEERATAVQPHALAVILGCIPCLVLVYTRGMFRFFVHTLSVLFSILLDKALLTGVFSPPIPGVNMP